jgi:hypothetical protein
VIGEIAMFTQSDRRKLDRILFLLEGVQTMAVDLTNLKQAVTDMTTVEKSAVTLISGLSAQITALAAETEDEQTQADLQALADQLEADKAELAAAITANTPASSDTTATPTSAGDPASASDTADPSAQ